MQEENNLNLRGGDHRLQAHIVTIEDQDHRHIQDHSPETETKTSIEIDTKIVMTDTDRNRENDIRIPKKADTVEVDQVNLRLTPDQTLPEARIISQIQDLKQS
jgi:hypothetical protein